MSCVELVECLEIDNEGFDIFYETLATYDKFSNDHTSLFASTLIHGDPNPSFILNECRLGYSNISNNCQNYHVAATVAAAIAAEARSSRWRTKRRK